LDNLNVEGEERFGVEIVKKALEEPVKQIAENAGQSGAAVVEKIKSSGKKEWGYDALRNEWVDLFQAGIVDPVKVTRTALEKAASIAAMVLTAETLVAEKPEKKESNLPKYPGGDMDMY